MDSQVLVAKISEQWTQGRYPFPIGAPLLRSWYLQLFLRYWASNILGSRVTTLTFQDHVTSSVTWPTDSQVAISYRWSIVTNSLSRAVFEILGSKHIGVTILTFQGLVTSSVTWPFDSQVAISYRWSIVTKSLSPAVFEILGSKHIGVSNLTFQGHGTSSVTWPLDSGWVIFYWWSFGSKFLSLTDAEISPPNVVCSWRHNAKSSLRMRDITWHVPPM